MVKMGIAATRTLSVSCWGSVRGDGVVELKLSSVKSISDTSLLARRTPDASHGRSLRPSNGPDLLAPSEAAKSSVSS